MSGPVSIVDPTTNTPYNAANPLPITTATSGLPVADAQLVPKGYAQVIATTTGQSLATLLAAAAVANPVTSAFNVIPAGSRIVYIQPETADIRFRDDGTAPTIALGTRIYAGTDYPLNSTLSAIQLAAVASTVTVNLRFEG